MGPAGVNTGPHERRAQAGPGSRRANLLVIDAFSSDAVPVHLLTREAPANVCGIHEYGEHGIFGYIAMDLVDGKDLRQVLRGSGELVWDEAFDVWQEVGPGFGYSRV